MIVIAKKADGYICQVSHTELEKLTENYYGKLKKLDEGSEMNLGAGYDFRDDIKRACRDMVEASTQFGRSQKSMLAFAVMVSKMDNAEETMP